MFMMCDVDTAPLAVVAAKVAKMCAGGSRKSQSGRRRHPPSVHQKDRKKDPSQHLPIRNRTLNQNPNTMTDTLTDCPPLVIRLMIVRETSTRRKRKKRIRSEKKRTS